MDQASPETDWHISTLLDLPDLPDLDFEDDKEYLPDVEMGSEEIVRNDTIAKRTRSKFPIDEEPGDVLDLPDVSEDLYEPNKELDDEWTEFLNSLYKDNPSNLFEDEENEDPDYDVFEELDGILGADGSELNIEEGTDPPKATETITSQELAEWSQHFTTDDLQLIYTQMTQHVQILTQQYLLTMTSQTLTFVAENAAKLLEEIKDLGSNKTVTLFKPPNLAGAIKIVEENPINPSNITVIANSWRQCPVPIIARPIFAANPAVFMYHSLLPKSGYPDVHTKKKCSKTVFTDAEDHLISMGLDQYKTGDRQKCYQLIKEHLLPTKTEYQIKMHIKNKTRHLKEIKSDPQDEKNPITYYLRYSKLMPTRRKSFPPPQQNYTDLSKLPIWLAKELDPKYSIVDSNKLPTRLKLSPLKAISTCKYSSTVSPHKHASNILKKYRHLSKFPYIKPKLDKTQENSVPDCSSAAIAIHYHPIESTPIIQWSQSRSSSQTDYFSNPSNTPVQAQLVSSTHPDKELVASSEDLETSELHDLALTTDQPIYNTNNHVKMPEISIPNKADNESDLLTALMVASSTITTNKGRTKSHEVQTGTTSKKEAKKSQNARHKESTALLLSENWSLNDCTKEQKEQVIVQFFMNKVREVLKSDEDYIRFLTYLNEFGQQKQQNNSLRELHRKTEKLLCKANAQQVMEEFVLLLNASQAQDCGKMYQYLHWKRYLSFIRKLEIYSLVEPNCVSRLYKSLVQLKSSETIIDKQKLRNAVSKAIGGHPYLMNEFSSLFLDEKPNDFLFASDQDFEHANPLSENPDSGQSFETLTLDLTQEERKYGTNECPCKHCHEDLQQTDRSSNNLQNGGESESDKKTNTTLRHCVACSIRFMGGKVYLQGSKKMQQAEVQYLSLEPSTEKASEEEVLNPFPSSPEPSSLNVSTFTNGVDSSTDLQADNPVDDTRPWSKTEDRTLLEYCKARAASDGCVNMFEVFREIGAKLARSCDQVAERFSKLIELFKNDTTSSKEGQIESTITTST